MVQKSSHDIIFVVGRTSSGKSTIARAIQQSNGYLMIETSSIIKAITGDTKRSNISCLPHLDQAAVEAIDNLWQHNDLIVCGTRQWSIIEPFAQWATIIWVDVPFDKREKWFLKRNDSSDDVTLRDVDQRDNTLGIPQIAAELVKRCTL